MVTSEDNTPAQLLALQRLADFPARAEYREHKRQLEVGKEERQAANQVHKTQMDLEKAARKKDMDQHRQRMAEERLALQKRALDLREKQLAASNHKRNLCPNPASAAPESPQEDELGPFAATLDEIEERACRKFGFPLPHRSSPAPSFASASSAANASEGLAPA